LRTEEKSATDQHANLESGEKDRETVGTSYLISSKMKGRGEQRAALRSILESGEENVVVRMKSSFTSWGKQGGGAQSDDYSMLNGGGILTGACH